jgi:hypothetical protein
MAWEVRVALALIAGVIDGNENALILVFEQISDEIRVG